jgi:sensor histidine kinase YesM
MNYLTALGQFLVENKSAMAAITGNGLIYMALLTPRWRWWTYPSAGLLFIMSTPLLFSFLSDTNYATSLNLIGYSLTLLNLLWFSNSIWQTLTLCMTISIINRLCTFFGYAISAGTDVNNYVLSVFIVICTVNLILAFVGWRWVRNYIRQLKLLTLRSFLWPLLTMMSILAKLLVDFFSNNTFGLNPASDQTMIWSMIALCVFTLSMLTLLLYYAISSAMLVTAKKTSDHLSYELNVQKRQYEAQLQNQHEVRRMKHDIKGHLITVAGLLRSGKQKEAEQYLSKITDLASISTDQTYANDPYIEAVISGYSTLFERNSVKFSCNIQITPIEKYPVELCLIFTNALQNALEASLKLPQEKRSISVTAKIKFDYIVLQVANRFLGQVELEDGFVPQTTKDSPGHGYGLTSIKTTLEAMDGVLHLRTDNDVFLLEATAKIK